MGRSGAARNRERTGSQARLVRQLPAIRSAARLHLLQRRVSLDEHAFGQRGTPGLWLAYTLSRQRRTRAGRTLRTFAARRDPRVSTRHGERRASARAARHRGIAAFARAHLGDARDRHDLSGVLSDDRVRLELGDHGAWIRAWGLADPADDRRAV